MCGILNGDIVLGHSRSKNLKDVTYFGQTSDVSIQEILHGPDDWRDSRGENSESRNEFILSAFQKQWI